jgi:eukaryotic-like serine/threonine-protein kinase
MGLLSLVKTLPDLKGPSTVTARKSPAEKPQSLPAPQRERDTIPSTVTVDAAPSETLPPGSQAGEYKVLGRLAEGGCGVIYKAQHSLLGRYAAIKVLAKRLVRSRTMQERFVREARAMSLLRHPNVVDVWGFGRLDDGRPFYVMELLDGTDLEAYILQRCRISPRECLTILEPVCSALHAAHQAGLVHRDLKASNVFLAREREELAVKLIDFGIAKLRARPRNEPTLTRHDLRVGTPTVMSPEQILGVPVDGRADVYALGVLLYRMLTGCFPFDERDLEELQRRHLHTPAPRPSTLTAVPPAVDDVVARALSKSPDDRPPTALEFAADLRRALSPRRTPAPVVTSAASVRAVGIGVEARLGEDGQAEPDEATLDLVAAALDVADRMMKESGFQLALRTGWTALGAHTLPEDERERGVRKGALSLAISMQETLRVMAGSNRQVYFTVCVHVDTATVRRSAQGEEIVGGRLLRFNTWNAGGAAMKKSACATLDALAGLPAWAADRPRDSRVVPLRLPE